MNHKQLIILLLSVAAIAAASVWFGVYHGQMEKEDEGLSTDGAGYVEENLPHADPFLVGKWQNDLNPQWFKVYYDDYDEDEGYFWGKEWDEADDVQEEDLVYHGNGWFRWKKEGKLLTELHTMDVQDVPIPKQWDVQVPASGHLILTDPNVRKCQYNFSRATE